eukprot:761813-Hanusia_phi.AAC.10
MSSCRQIESKTIVGKTDDQLPQAVSIEALLAVADLIETKVARRSSVPYKLTYQQGLLLREKEERRQESQRISRNFELEHAARLQVQQTRARRMAPESCVPRSQRPTAERVSALLPPYQARLKALQSKVAEEKHKIRLSEQMKSGMAVQVDEACFCYFLTRWVER